MPIGAVLGALELRGAAGHGGHPAGAFLLPAPARCESLTVVTCPVQLSGRIVANLIAAAMRCQGSSTCFRTCFHAETHFVWCAAGAHHTICWQRSRPQGSAHGEAAAARSGGNLTHFRSEAVWREQALANSGQVTSTQAVLEADSQQQTAAEP